MSDPQHTAPQPENPNERMSPIHPQRPEAFRHAPAEQPAQPPPEKQWASEPASPQERLALLREKMETVANEYARREISRAQFNAIYGHYSEQRAIIERIISRDPSNDGWKQASRSGKTSFLREHFEARPVNYVIYLHHQPRPLMGGGTRPDMQRIAGLLKTLWNMDKLRVGVVRILLREPTWLVMAAGRKSVSFVTYHLEPSGTQMNRVYDLHKDFERANRILLERQRINKGQMVFPQRSLIENKK